LRLSRSPINRTVATRTVGESAEARDLFSTDRVFGASPLRRRTDEGRTAYKAHFLPIKRAHFLGIGLCKCLVAKLFPAKSLLHTGEVYIEYILMHCTLYNFFIFGRAGPILE
jgi:hypothetical protein